jgi:hypothetical protein
MTDQQTDLRYREDGYDADDFPSGVDLVDGPRTDMYDEYDEYDEYEYDDGSALDESLDDWDGYAAAARRPPPESRPWYRDPRWLFGLIALAAAALVVATVLLVTGRGSGEIPTAPELTTRTPASTIGVPSFRNAPPQEPASESASSSATTPTSASSASEVPSVVDIPASVEPSASAAEAPPEPIAGPNKSPAGPRINVTRTPMSFSPGKH